MSPKAKKSNRRTNRFKTSNGNGDHDPYAVKEISLAEKFIMGNSYFHLLHNAWSETNEALSEPNSDNYFNKFQGLLNTLQPSSDLREICLEENMEISNVTYHMGLIDIQLQPMLEQKCTFSQEFKKHGLKSRLRQNPRKRRFPDMVQNHGQPSLAAKRVRKIQESNIVRSGTQSPLTELSSSRTGTPSQLQGLKQHKLLSSRNSLSPKKTNSLLDTLRWKLAKAVTSSKSTPVRNKRNVTEERDNVTPKRRTTPRLVEKNNEPFPSTRSTAHPRQCQGARRVLDWKFCYADKVKQSMEEDESHCSSSSRSSKKQTTQSIEQLTFEEPSISTPSTISVGSFSSKKTSHDLPAQSSLSSLQSSSPVTPKRVTVLPSSFTPSAKAKVKDFLLKKAATKPISPTAAAKRDGIRKILSSPTGGSSPSLKKSVNVKNVPSNLPSAMRDVLNNIHFHAISEDREHRGNGFWIRGIPRTDFIILSSRYGAGNSEYVLQSIDVKDASSDAIYDVLLVSQLPANATPDDVKVVSPKNTIIQETTPSPIMAQQGVKSLFHDKDLSSRHSPNPHSLSSPEMQHSSDSISSKASSQVTSKQDYVLVDDSPTVITLSPIEENSTSNNVAPRIHTMSNHNQNPVLPSEINVAFSSMSVTHRFSMPAYAGSMDHVTPNVLSFRRPLPPTTVKPVRKVYTKTTTRPSILCHNRKSAVTSTPPLLTSQLTAHGHSRVLSTSMGVLPSSVTPITTMTAIRPNTGRDAFVSSEVPNLITASTVPMLSTTSNVIGSVRSSSLTVGTVRSPMSAGYPQFLYNSIRSQGNLQSQSMQQLPRLMPLSTAVGNPNTIISPSSAHFQASSSTHVMETVSSPPVHTVAMQPVKRGTWQVSKTPKATNTNVTGSTAMTTVTHPTSQNLVMIQPSTQRPPSQT